MAGFQLNIGSPLNFADWTRYAGFDPNKPLISGIAPPGQEKAPVAPTIKQFTDRLGDVGTQLAQGNFQNAAKTFTTGAAVMPAVSNPMQSKDKDGDGMISEWEE